MPHSLSSQPPCCVRDFFAHGHTWLLGSVCTSFPSWCKADPGSAVTPSRSLQQRALWKHQSCSLHRKSWKGSKDIRPHPGDPVPFLLILLSFPLLGRWWLLLWAGAQEPGCVITPCSEHQGHLSLYWKAAAGESSSQVRSLLGWFQVSPGQAVGALLRGWAVKPDLWLWELVQVSDTCLYNPRMCLVHKICLGLCWINFQMFLRVTMPLKYGFYNQSFSFGSWRQLSTVLLLYSVLSDIPKHPTKRLSLQSWDSEYLQQCSAASISESINSSLQEESTLSIPICTSTLKNNFRKQMNHCRAIKRIK